MPLDPETERRLSEVQRQVEELQRELRTPFSNHQFLGGAGILQDKISAALNGTALLIAGNNTLNDDITDLRDGTGLADSAITTAKIAASAITTAKLAVSAAIDFYSTITTDAGAAVTSNNTEQDLVTLTITPAVDSDLYLLGFVTLVNTGTIESFSLRLFDSTNSVVISRGGAIQREFPTATAYPGCLGGRITDHAGTETTYKLQFRGLAGNGTWRIDGSGGDNLTRGILILELKKQQ